MEKLIDVLTDKNDNYLYPFFWQSGSSAEVITDNIDQIRKSGIKGLCVESRVHPDFLGDSWWEDLDLIIKEAKKRQMKIWILDDVKFPTGYANGKIKNEYPQLRKKYLYIHQLDFCGPHENASINLKWAIPNGRMKIRDNQLQPDILAVVMAKKIGDNQLDYLTLKVINNEVIDDILDVDIPDGEWRVFVCVRTTEGGELSTEDYLNPLEKEATQVLIDEVYEQHFSKYSSEFGSTIMGFFSDEPRFGNAKGTDCIIGKKDMCLPWSDLVEKELLFLEGTMNEDRISLLPLLTSTEFLVSEENHYRAEYMNIVTKLYKENFSDVLGQWCQAHHCEYIGHVIEDNGAHRRLGYGTGHFSRALSGQSISGIDVVMNQIMPYMDTVNFKASTEAGWDGEFFHYCLGKLGSSLGKLDENKQGRTMCEIFGAYGWNENIYLMYYLINHMLLRGINYFVPHAFSTKKFPDYDCPPHFYANGNDPLFEYMSILNEYTNRMCHLLNGGKGNGKIALLYDAEIEWVNQRSYFEKVCRFLFQNQFEFEIVTIDDLEKAGIKFDEININEYIFTTLIIPTSKGTVSEYLNLKLSDFANVHYIDENLNEKEAQVLINHLKKFEGQKAWLGGYYPDVRLYSYSQKDGDLIVLFNEGNSTVTFDLHLETDFQGTYEYNALTNQMNDVCSHNAGNIRTISNNLMPNQSKVLVFCDSAPSLESGETQDVLFRQMKVLDLFSVYILSENKEVLIAEGVSINEAKAILNKDYRRYSGKVIYESVIDFEEIFRYSSLEIMESSDVIEIYINDHLIGRKITSPYIFNSENVLRKKDNIVRICVINSLGRQELDYFSQFSLMNQLGLTQAPILKLL